VCSLRSDNIGSWDKLKINKSINFFGKNFYFNVILFYINILLASLRSIICHIVAQRFFRDGE